MPDAQQPTVQRRVGVVGAGQLARMMGEAAGALGLELTVLATSADDSAVATCDHVILGEATDTHALRELARRVDVVTFDHELVNLELLKSLEEDGVVLRPSSDALHHSVDKAYQRRTFRDHGLPVPRFLVVSSSLDEGLESFLDGLDAPPVIKSARGGYDGRGVVVTNSRDEARAAIEEMASRGEVVIEERMELRAEVAQVVARASNGELRFYPVVTTVQRDGMCSEVRFPSELDEAMSDEATRLSTAIANLVRGVALWQSSTSSLTRTRYQRDRAAPA